VTGFGLRVFGCWSLEGFAMFWTVRATLLSLLAALPLWAAASGDLPASAMGPENPACATPGLFAPGALLAPPAANACAVWLVADADGAAASFDRLSASGLSPVAGHPVVGLAAEQGAAVLAPSHRGAAKAATLGAQPSEGLSFQGIPLGLCFTALVVLAYALRRVERVWPQPVAAEGAAKVAFLTTQAGRL
jgi:hypothetical protein